MHQPPEKLCSAESERTAREFVDNWSYYISLLNANDEREIMQLLDLLEKVRNSWQKSDTESRRYKSQVVTLEEQLKEAEKANSTLNDLLLNCQSQLTHLMNSKQDIEGQLSDYKRRFELLRNIIKSAGENLIVEDLLTIVNGPQLKRTSPVRNNNLDNNTTTTGTTVKQQNFGNKENDEGSTMESTQSEISFDKTGESIDESSDEYPPTSRRQRSSRKRRSQSHGPNTSRSIVRFENHQPTIREDVEFERTPSKRSRTDAEITATIKIDPSGRRQPSGTVNIRQQQPLRKRSMSENNLADRREKILPPRTYALTPGRSTFDLRSPIINAKSWTLGQEIDRRLHRVTGLFSIFETCDVCKKKFGIAAQNALRCVDCGTQFHRNCQGKAIVPCVPRKPMSKTPSKLKADLHSYCPESHPFIPPLMIHCIVALERDRLTREGIYRMPGMQTAVDKLYTQFLTARVVPSLAKIETENITGVIKRFLKELRDSLIPSTSFDEFLTAVENNDEQAICASVLDLPAPNRDTLAYFILHLQRVASNSSHNKMPLENIARVLAPTIVGYSPLSAPTLENHQNLTRGQYSIVLRLLKIPSEFWRRFIENNMSVVMAEEARTPGSRTGLLTLTTPTRSVQSSSRRPEHIMESEGSAHPSDHGSPLIQPLRSSRIQSSFFKDPL